jgi:hypothetical protein
MSSRRDFLKRLGIGVTGSLVTPMPGTALAEPNVSTTDRSVNTRQRATDEPAPKADYGLQVKSDYYAPNPDLTRVRSDGSVGPDTSSTFIYLKGWIDEEAYGIVNAHGEVDEAKRQQLSEAFGAALIAADRIMSPALRIMRQSALRAKVLQAGVELPL